MTLSLKIGSTYMSDPDAVDASDPNKFVTIVGSVDPETIEYTQGYRFYADTGWCYTPTGECSRSNAWRDLNLLQEFNPDPNWAYIERFWISSNAAKGFIPVTHTDFRLRLGSLYLDRMGKLHLLTEVSKWGNSNKLLYSTNYRVYEDTGRISTGSDKSMYDLVYQLIY